MRKKRDVLIQRVYCPKCKRIVDTHFGICLNCEYDITDS